MKYGDNPKKGKRKMKKAARKMSKSAKKGALATIVGSAAMKAKKKDAYSGSSEPKTLSKRQSKKVDKKNYPSKEGRSGGKTYTTAETDRMPANPRKELGWADLKNKKDNYSKKNGKKK